MPKIKTHKSTAKRFRVTGNRKLRRLKNPSAFGAPSTRTCRWPGPTASAYGVSSGYGSRRSEAGRLDRPARSPGHASILQTKGQPCEGFKTHFEPKQPPSARNCGNLGALSNLRKVGLRNTDDDALYLDALRITSRRATRCASGWIVGLVSLALLLHRNVPRHKVHPFSPMGHRHLNRFVGRDALVHDVADRLCHGRRVL
jgi:hypothetical protein